MTDYSEVLEVCEINGKTINVYGCWNSVADYEAGKDPEFYDIYEADGMISTCLNEGDPYYEKPTVADCEELLKRYYGEDEPYYQVIVHDNNFGTELPSIQGTASFSEKPKRKEIINLIKELKGTMAELYYVVNDDDSTLIRKYRLPKK